MRIGLIAMMICGFLSLGLAQDHPSTLETDVDHIKATQQTILEELKAIKTLLSRLPAAPPEIEIRGKLFNLSGKPLIGAKSSKLVMIEVSDYQCSFCGRYSRETFPELKKQYIDTGMIEYAVIDLPLPIHPLAPKAAEAAHCAEDQGKFWEMHHQLMSNQQSLDKLASFAEVLNLDKARYEGCLNGGLYAGRVAQDVERMQKIGINGVPAFILAAKDPTNPLSVKGISIIRGAAPMAHFQGEISKALAEVSK